MSLWLSLDVQQTQTPSPFVAAAISQRKESRGPDVRLSSRGCAFKFPSHLAGLPADSNAGPFVSHSPLCLRPVLGDCRSLSCC